MCACIRKIKTSMMNGGKALVLCRQHLSFGALIAVGVSRAHECCAGFIDGIVGKVSIPVKEGMKYNREKKEVAENRVHR